METFTKPRGFVTNPDFARQKVETLKSLDPSDLDPPIVDIVADFNRLQYCYTLQICWGHFVYEGQTDIHNLARLPTDPFDGEIDYRLAYIALCLADDQDGKALFDRLAIIPRLDPDYIQFGSADWFWERHLNSYAVQVEPARYQHRDRAQVDFGEALHLQKVRDMFYAEIRLMLNNLLNGATW
ncbi:MAG: hypothetical protein PVF49_11380 [Anaerolineales bacterium]